MTTANSLVLRVRANINEPTGQTDPLRTDAEILQWLDDGQNDYLHQVPMEHFPELVSSKTFSGSSCALPDDYKFFYGMTITHTLSGTATGVDECWVLSPGDNYLINNYPGYMGAWCQVVGSTISCGPSAIRGTLSYIKTPSSISATTSTFGLSSEHEAPIVNYASAMALEKINDADFEKYMALYTASIAAKKSRDEAAEIERA